ncbi:glutamate racemase [Leptotrichia sp. oral taxon 847]|uniref:glutamate racemase n=1 Tax=Leptotrichia sp. oral taxon 847 TaxID=1785996 RepID=UPI000767ED76|nr:glutamate racemase [Leptotrichia sp. oral taxon 847]AMD95311.1 glutamate racemase [Leptotrichia sp. oral taxon 847]
MSIGVFDSGIGGLTVLKEIRKVLPNEKIFYFGDTARVPYGEKTKELITRYSKQIVEFLLEKKVSAIVVACNTATALALEELKKTFKIPIIGVIKAGARTAISTTKSGNIGVIGTKATVNSKRYEEEIKKLNENVKVVAKACPLFVPAVEEGILDGKLVDQIIKTYLDDFEKEIDTLILGCTHYPLLKSAIGKIYTDLNIVDPARETALDLKEILEEKNLLKNDATKNKEVKYYVTDGKDKFKEIGIMFLDENIEKVELVKL